MLSNVKMSNPTELSFDEILQFMLFHNGKVTNHELVKHFKVFLTNPEMRDEARNTFKKHVNSLAVIKNHNNEKWLILKKKYMPNNQNYNSLSSESTNAVSTNSLDSPKLEIENVLQQVPDYPPLPLQLNQDLTIIKSLMLDNQIYPSGIEMANLPEEPPAVPKRHSHDRDKYIENKSVPYIPPIGHKMPVTPENSTPGFDQSLVSKNEVTLVDEEQTISVKERKQMFNRMASEGDILKTHQGGNNTNTLVIDEEDRASIRSLDHKAESDPLDPKQKAWILCAAKGEYHALAKMCSENSKLVRTKDPFTTAMHWACKRGDENLVKLLAGVSKNLVNEKTGYTPLHIAMQFRHETVFRLLTEVYDADSNSRDWSGKKPNQYLIHMDTSLSPGFYRKKESFLRIGSLNVRVKKTTEAFSNFLGVGATRASTYGPKSARLENERRVSDDIEHLHKNWGSADNIPKEDKLMPPPMSSKVRRRGATGRKGTSVAHSRSTPSTPDQTRAHISVTEEVDSDSDTAAGFHSAWRQQRSSDYM